MSNCISAVRKTTLAHILNVTLFLFFNTVWLTNKNTLKSFRCQLVVEETCPSGHVK